MACYPRGMRLTMIVAVMLAGLPATGCDSQACTLIGCGSSFQIEFERPAWPAGDYKVTLVADGETIECSATFPLQCDGPPACPESSKVVLGLSGCALAPSQQSLTHVEFMQGSTPKSVEVTVHQDDALLGEAAYSPEYSDSHPNGPDCDPKCTSAEAVKLTLQ